jgi:hypothetical protein
MTLVVTSRTFSVTATRTWSNLIFSFVFVYMDLAFFCILDFRKLKRKLSDILSCQIGLENWTWGENSDNKQLVFMWQGISGNIYPGHEFWI